MKKFLILFMLMFLTGCSAEYTLDISNNSFKENINVIIPNSAIDQDTSNKNNESIETDDRLTTFIEGKTESLVTNDKYYKKKAKKIDDYTKVEMKYRYNSESIKKASSINLCFEYPELNFSENYYINLQGKFYCLYGDSVDIKIRTNNKVYFNNADEISGNEYIWHINNSNSDYVNIQIEIDKGISFANIIIAVITIVILLSLGYITYIFIKKRRGIDDI